MVDLSAIHSGPDDEIQARLVMCRALGPLIEDPLNTAALERVCAVQDMLVNGERPQCTPTGGVPR